MAGNRLSKFQTISVYSVIALVGILGTLGIALEPARAQQPGYGPGYGPYPQQDIYGGLCQSALKGVIDVTSYCEARGFGNDLATCMRQNIQYCEAEKSSAGARILSGDGTDGYDTNEYDCDRIKDAQRNCPGLYAVTPEEARRSMKDSRSMRKDLDKERREARNDDAQRMKDAQKELNEIDDKFLENDDQHNKERKQLTDRLQQSAQQVAAKQMEAFKAAQVQYDQIDMKYIEMRNDMRRKNSQANEVELTWSTQCRSRATDVANEAEAALDARIAEEQKLSRNYRFTNAAGQLRRLMKQKRQRIINKYNQYLSQCLRGETDPGATLKLQLSQRKNDVRDSGDQAKDMGARLEKLRQLTKDNLDAMMKNLEAEQRSLQMQVQGDIQLLDTKWQANINRLNTRRQQAVQNQMMDQMRAMRDQQEMNARLGVMMEDEAAASAEYKCYVKMAQTQMDEESRKRAAAIDGYGYLKRTCEAKGDSYVIGVCDGEKARLNVADVCKAALLTKASEPNSSPTGNRAPSGDAGPRVR